jgi:mannose-6-phosphate isomerase-like protein (cupin superfamily)
MAVVATPIITLVIGGSYASLAAINGLVGVVFAWIALNSHASRRYWAEVCRERDGCVLEREALGKADDAARHAVRWRRHAQRRVKSLGMEFGGEVEVLGAGQHITRERDVLVFLLDGRARFIDLERSETIEAKAGDALFIPAGLRYEVRLAGVVQVMRGVGRSEG